MDYTKQTLTLAQQIETLKQRGLIIEDEAEATAILDRTSYFEDLYPFKSLHFEALHGDKEGRFSVKANDQYRVEFTLTETEDDPVVTICNIMELSNHYK